MSDDFYEFSKEAEEEQLRQRFRDFLIAPEISGTHRTVSASKRIPAERITDSGEIVEVSQEIHDEEDHHSESSVVVHRNDANEITGIEILCSCGRRTTIRLENDPEHGQDDFGDGSSDYSSRMFGGHQPDSEQPL